MFNRICKKCRGKIDRKFSFCPFCGNNIEKEKEEENFGFLGREDEIPGFIKTPDIGIKMPFGFDTIFNSLLKEVDKQFKELDRQIGNDIEQEKNRQKMQSSGISISISSSSGKEPQIRVSGFGPEFPAKEESFNEKKAPQMKINEEQGKKLASLPRKEAETQVRRLSNKIIYEVEMPGVKSIKEVIINRLENSIEIKAFSEDKVYFKLIPLNCPILDYKLEKGKLILELKPKN